MLLSCYFNFRLEYKTSGICHNVNTQNVKFARRDRPRILLHTDVKPLKTFFTYWYCSSEENSFRDFTLKNLNDDFYQYRFICIYSLYIVDQDRARYSVCSAQEKCVSCTTDSKILICSPWRKNKVSLTTLSYFISISNYCRCWHTWLLTNTVRLSVYSNIILL